MQINSQRVPGKHIYHQRERERGTKIMSAKGTQKEREGARCARPSGGVDCIGMHLAGQWENVCNLTSIVWQIGLHLLNQLKHPLLNTHTHTRTEKPVRPCKDTVFQNLLWHFKTHILHWKWSAIRYARLKIRQWNTNVELDTDLNLRHLTMELFVVILFSVLEFKFWTSSSENLNSKILKFLYLKVISPLKI